MTSSFAAHSRLPNVSNRSFWILVLLALGLGPVIALAESLPVPKEIQALIGAPDRTPEDKNRDGVRRPGELLTFAGIKPGMMVFELGSGSGYTSELLARAVGKDGRVIAHNSPYVLEHYVKGAMDQRLAKPVMANVSHWVAEFDQPLPAETANLDAAFAVLIYHDLLSTPTDRDAMNRTIYAALKPSGVYIVVDHSGKAGANQAQTAKIHRIDENLVVTELQAVGFKLVDSAGFLRNPNDPREQFFRELKFATDRFVLKFVKPE